MPTRSIATHKTVSAAAEVAVSVQLLPARPGPGPQRAQPHLDTRLSAPPGAMALEGVREHRCAGDVSLAMGTRCLMPDAAMPGMPQFLRRAKRYSSSWSSNAPRARTHARNSSPLHSSAVGRRGARYSHNTRHCRARVQRCHSPSVV